MYNFFIIYFERKKLLSLIYVRGLFVETSMEKNEKGSTKMLVFAPN